MRQECRLPVGEERVYLNIGAWEQRSVANGPGERFVLWMQGCPLRCPGCINPEFLPFIRRKLVTVDEMAQKILAVKGIEGVTYTGGEPMVQAKALTLLSEKLRNHGLTIVCYTGYTLEELKERNDHWIERLLSNVDILIDGRYVREQAGNLLWRGSSNQRIHFLTKRYRHLASVVDRSPVEVELIVGSEGFTATGLWPEGFLERLREALK